MLIRNGNTKEEETRKDEKAQTQEAQKKHEAQAVTSSHIFYVYECELIFRYRNEATRKHPCKSA